MANETLMTDPAATTTEGASASNPATDAPATGADEGGQQQAPQGQGTESQSTEGSKAEGEKPEEKPDGAPESYEFAQPEGVNFDEAVIGAFSDVAKELDLPQDKAQKVIDKVAPLLAQRQHERLAEANSQWVESAKTDKEYGGDNLQENLGVAKKAFDHFSTPELRTLLNETGLGNHPEVIRVFYRAGKMLSEDSFAGGRSSSKEISATAQRFYAASKMNP